METVFGNTNLSGTKGLESCSYIGPSTVDHRTLAKSGKLPLKFLRGVGLPDTFIDYLPSLLGDALEFYSCFISYSSKDQKFAKRLHADLQDKGVRCWFAPEDLKIGARTRPAIDEAIRIRDKLLLILSERSIESDWVEKEVETAFEGREPAQGDCPVSDPAGQQSDGNRRGLGGRHSPHTKHRRLPPLERPRRLSGGVESPDSRPEARGGEERQSTSRIGLDRRVRVEIEEILAKGADAAIEQVGKAVSKVTGSPAGEFGELLADHIRFRRAENLVKFYVKYQRIVEAAGIDQTAVPFRLWFPIFDSASIEEDDSLQQKWAALLANAANPDSDVSVLPVFAGILGQISPGQAALMDWFYKGEDEPAGIVSATEVSNVCQVGLTDASLMLDPFEPAWAIARKNYHGAADTGPRPGLRSN